jgi:putative (di)nucleoside polyphosphate hydrolase
MLSAGVIVRRAPGELLLCHATLRRYWDLPKGECAADESADVAAARELHEETGIAALTTAFADLGRHSYRPGKDLHVFLLDTDADPVQLSTLRCSSTFFEPRRRLQLPEVDAYRWATRGELAGLCVPAMCRVLQALAW